MLKSFNKFNIVKANKISFDYATNNRRHTFEDLKPFATKVINAFRVSGADKLYVKSVFGANSPQYLQVSKLEFKTINW